MAISLAPDLCALDAASYCVGTMASPPCMVRLPIVTVTRDIVAQAVRRRVPSSSDPIELQVWTYRDHVRVVIRGSCDLLGFDPAGHHRDRPQRSLGRLADRWAIESDDAIATIWFEIDFSTRTPTTQARHRRRVPTGDAMTPIAARTPRALPARRSRSRATCRSTLAF